MRDNGLAAKVTGIGKRASERIQLFGAAGQIMRDEVLPKVFTSGGGENRWQRPQLRSGPPMLDTMRLASSITYEATPDRLAIFTIVPYAGVHNRPAGTYYTHTPSQRKYIAVPNPATLTPTEFRSAKPRDFPEAFFLKAPGDDGPARVGPQGRGIYARDGAGRGVVLLFWLKESVRIPARPFLYWTQDALRKIGIWWRYYILTGRFPGGASSVPTVAGVPDVGNRGGRP